MAGRDDRLLDLTVSPEGIRALGDALKAESDGKALRKELAKGMRQALMPAAVQARSGIMSMSSTTTESPALRPSIAKKIRPEVKLGGMWTGARVKAKKTPGVRGFRNAPKRTQRAAGWRTQTYGNGTWRDQHGKVDWFDRAMQGDTRAQAKRAVAAAMNDMAARIAARAARGSD